MKVHLITTLLSVIVFFTAMSFSSTITYTRFVEAGTLLATAVASDEPTSDIRISEGFEKVTAESVFVVDARTGHVLYERLPDEVRPIASISKLFTAAVVMSVADMEDTLTIAQGDIATEGAAGNLRAGEVYTFRELLFPFLLTSSNDAGTAFVRSLGPTAFADGLTDLFSRAGLTDTMLVEPTGLSAQNRSTARELAELILHLEEHFSYILSVTTLPSYQGKLKGWQSNIPGRNFSSFQGGKHGYIPEAGQTYIGLFERDGESFVVVLLDSDSLNGDLAAISDMLE
ncbi:MAG: serine hydrolase [Candidatus Paceibacterota bacterium]